MIQDFAIEAHSHALFQLLKTIPELVHLSMTKRRHGNEDWYDIIGSINVPERARAFEAVCKEPTPEEAYTVFMRIDRNITADNYEEAQLRAERWVQQTIAQPLKETFHTTWVRIEHPLERRTPTLGNRVR
jgi:hypothetical protein